MTDSTPNTPISQTLDFARLPLRPELLDNLATLGYHKMTAIQAQSLPLILQGDDVIAKAKTGSGKTAAFGLGLLSNIDAKRFYTQAMVLCPTRELADQVAKEIRKLARALHNVKVLTLCGGMPFGPQVNSLKHGAHIIVGTPGRIEEHCRKNNLRLDKINCLVLDEADRMLDAGFQESLEAIFEKLSPQRQTLLFSATFAEKIEAIAENFMQRPQFVDSNEAQGNSNIEQHFYPVDGRGKNCPDEDARLQGLQLLLLKQHPKSCIVFCNTKKETTAVADELKSMGFTALALHGDLEQKQRNTLLVRFSHGSASVLVATDVAARGLDIDQLDLVINFHPAKELTVHTHRIGRTGRAGESGIAFTLYNDKQRFKIDKLKRMAMNTGQVVIDEALPAENYLDKPTYKPPMVTLQIDGGKKQKIRPGDIVGALTASNTIQGSDIGKIAIFDFSTFVSVKRDIAADALSTLNHGKIKAKTFRVRKV